MTSMGPGRFDSAYDGAPPPWDIGRPQPDYAALAVRGTVHGPLLDVGCGTGENLLAFAERGVESVGIDIVPRAIEKAREKAAARGVSATFEIADALALESLARTFKTIIECGVFHVFDDESRVRYVESLARAIEPGGVYHMLVFSDAEPLDWGGPRRIRRDEIEAAFAHGWTIRSIVPSRLETNLHPDGGGHGWFATIDRRR